MGNVERFARILVELENTVWLKDINNPTTPEGRALHNKMQEILKSIQTYQLEVAKMDVDEDCVYC